ncbi:DEAD/DEAH box helicase [Algoriphagus lutimaris]|uniref:DEAD/DEAH box helicase n=1 Tax=Algoriphagus lutimaris TaxID=613197 RepID=UPI00196AAE87|nr:DEAD/DEAH box helicase [Algoriphagus lutimaris]MBN3520109.1 DEAD/DEAH box helicase [Algoriphagus lutimaris]
MTFKELGLNKQLISAIEKANYQKPYPIQAEAIPAFLKRQDILGIAPTGSGKTASYILPILQILQNKKEHRSRNIPVLVLVPTRELASQVAQVADNFSRFLERRVKTVSVFGGVSINPQMMKMNGTDILVATPGRLLDLISQNALSLSEVEILVLDEMDKVLNMGFREEVNQILSEIPKKRQNILFSATMDETLEEMISSLLKDPKRITVKPEILDVDLINQYAYRVSAEKKGPLLRHLIKNGNWTQILVFTSSIRTANNVVQKLVKNGIDAIAFHGDKSQGARIEALARFKSGKTQVLVATDLAGRGIDIQFLPLVINFELPRSPKDYVHRIGRTGRAGATGEAISLITEEDLHHFKIIQKKMKKHVQLRSTDDLDL